VKECIKNTKRKKKKDKPRLKSMMENNIYSPIRIIYERDSIMGIKKGVINKSE
jgi:hypothetical protein